MPLTVPSGPYAVSTLTLEVPARDPRSFQPNQFRLNGKPIFQLQTILVTFFYPTDVSNVSKRPSHNAISWLPTPKWKSMEGLVKYAGLSKYFTYPALAILPYFAKLPYTNDAALASKSPHYVSGSNSSSSSNSGKEAFLQESSSPASSSKVFPVGVFSHGLAGSRTTYSQYLAELASHGVVVASVEHRDGSGPSTTIQHKEGKRQETLTYFKYDELDAEVDDVKKGPISEMRKAQLELRQCEVLEVVNVLKQLNEGKGDMLEASSSRPVDPKAKLSEWKGHLNLGNLWTLGHSFGGATSIELIRKPDSIFTSAIVLDPWLEMIRKVGEGEVESVKKPLFVINSEAFTVWQSHFAQLREFVQESWKASGQSWLMTMTKTAHTDFSDFPLLMPRFFKNKTGVPSETLVKAFSQASVMQMMGHFDRKDLKLPVRDEISGEVEQRDLGKGGQFVWHPVDPNPTPRM
ncbi:hypothetical protein CBS101457_004400 [Exobasidium rhododendri]|nr:hypothetical protein CBS101457_004400 [Exobasidium rhododendri]